MTNDVKDLYSGNGAREAVAGWLNVPLERADVFLAALWVEGFKLVPVDDKEEEFRLRLQRQAVDIMNSSASQKYAPPAGFTPWG